MKNFQINELNKINGAFRIFHFITVVIIFLACENKTQSKIESAVEQVPEFRFEGKDILERYGVSSKGESLRFWRVSQSIGANSCIEISPVHDDFKYFQIDDIG